MRTSDAPAEVQEAPASRLPGKRLLLAEDDEATRRLLAGVLRRHGYEVVEACDGSDLLARLEASVRRPGESPFAAIVADNQMPEMTGLDVLAALHCARWRVPVILMTAFADGETRAEARAFGAFAFLEKPIDVAELEAALGGAVCPR